MRRNNLLNVLITLSLSVSLLTLVACGSSNNNESPATSKPDADPITTSDFTPISLKSTINNVQPMTGIVFWADNSSALDNLGDTVQLEFSYILYSDIVQQVGQYNWQVLDDLLDGIAGRGHQAILRFRYTYPGYTAVSVPDSIANSADYNIMIDKVEEQDTFLPDWSNTALQDFTLQFFVDFAARYDGDPRLAMLQVGFGSYAEYHLFDGPVSLGSNFPSKTFQVSFFETMIANFTDTQWSVSIDAANDHYTPLSSNSTLLDAKFGLFDDSFMHETHSSSDSEYNRNYWLFFGSERYQASMAGGEFSYYSDYDQQHVLSLPSGPWGRTFESFAEQYNISYIIGNNQYGYQSATRIKEASMATGYKFNINSFAASSTQTRVTISNTGIAPIYYDAYPTIDGTRASISLKGLLPGHTLDFEFAVGGSAPLLSIESDHLVAGQSIEYSADL